MIRRMLRRMAGIKSDGNGRPVDDLGRARSLEAQQRVFIQAEEIEASEEEFETKLCALKRRISDTDIRRKEADNAQG